MHHFSNLRLLCLLSAALFLTASPRESIANPTLVPGVWKNISPPAVDLSGFGIAVFQIDPGNPDIIYANPDAQGLWKTTDAGSTWRQLGTRPSSPDWAGISAGHVTYLDCTSFMEIDPNNSNHIYASQGTRGNTLGFWVSTDGGETWDRPAGFAAVSQTIGTGDMSTIRVDPTDFNHILLASHSTWRNGYTSFGILESTDGGAGWIIHPPAAGWGGGSMSLNMLYDPAHGIGDNKTWIVTLDGQGAWRTTNAGTSWAEVPSLAGKAPHGGTDMYRASTGVLFAPATLYPVRSTDNGVTWTQLTNGIPGSYYLGLCGDGTTLYTMNSYGLTGTPHNDPWLCASETDGTLWAPYQGGTQKFGNGPYTMHFDKKNRIMYSANWGAGLWALKVLGGTSARVSSTPVVARSIARGSAVKFVKAGLRIRTAGGKIFDVKGRQGLLR